jgi:uncharacterized protein YlbG (UPF0298 family)
MLLQKKKKYIYIYIDPKNLVKCIKTLMQRTHFSVQTTPKPYFLRISYEEKMLCILSYSKPIP